MIEVIKSGLRTTVQDYPGRIGYLNVGIPPSGPMDSLAFRIANRLVGNNEGEAGMEITLLGPKLKFNCNAIVAFTGAKFNGTVDGQKIPWWRSIFVKKDAVIDLKAVDGPGCRSYMAIKGGIDVPEYLGSKSTFPKGGFGGHKESPMLAKGTKIRLNKSTSMDYTLREIEPHNFPHYADIWNIGAVPSPHSAPDYFTPEAEEMFFGAYWFVHQDSNRLGYRLKGPKLSFARKDGGEGGSHPSNLIDYPYAIGTVNFTGNVPIILTVDGPSLGGFISLATIPTSELWKVGQARPNNIIRFVKMKYETAVENLNSQEQMLRKIVIKPASSTIHE